MGDSSKGGPSDSLWPTGSFDGYLKQLQEWGRRTQENMAAAERGAWPITVWSKPVNIYDNTVIKVPGCTWPFEAEPQPEAETEDAANPASVASVSLDDIKAHLADTFTAEDLDVAGGFVTTFAFPAERHVYLAIEDDGGKTRVFRVDVQEIV